MSTQDLSTEEMSTQESSARQRAKAYADLLWHIGAFVIINAFFWILDAVTGGGITWAFWITFFWGFALAFHALAWMIQGRQLEQRRAAAYLRRHESESLDR